MNITKLALAFVTSLVLFYCLPAQAGMCTGTVVAKDRILTAAHCVETSPFSMPKSSSQRATLPAAYPSIVLILIDSVDNSLKIRFSDGTTVPAKAIRVGQYEGGPDLAVLEAKTGNRPVIELAKLPLAPEMCLHVGCGGEPVGDLKVIPCRFTAQFTQTFDGETLSIIVSNVMPGDSGGPVLGRDQKLIGVLTRGIGGTTNSFAVPLEVIYKFLDGVVKQ